MQTLIPSTDHRGITYPSQKDMCDAYGVEQSLFKKRIDRGWSVQDALEGKKPYYEADGVKYWTQKETCAAFGISPNTFRAKLKEGYTKDEIVRKEFLKKTIGLNNQKFFSEEEMCKSYGVKRSTYRKRMKKTGDKSYALSTKDQRKRENRSRVITCGDIEIKIEQVETISEARLRLEKEYAKRVQEIRRKNRDDE